MGCWEHNKDIVGKCNWCGNPLCVNCIAKEVGKKVYCRKCASSLSQVKPFEKPKPLVREVEESKIPDKLARSTVSGAYGLNRDYSFKKPATPETMRSNVPISTVKRIESDAYELDKGYVLRKPMQVNNPKPIERPLSSNEFNTPREGSATKHSGGFFGMHRVFDEKQERPLLKQESRQPNISSMNKEDNSTSRQAAQSALSFLANQVQRQEPRQSSQQLSQNLSSQGQESLKPLSRPVSVNNTISQVSDSSSKQAAQSALSFLADQAKETGAKFKK